MKNCSSDIEKVAFRNYTNKLLIFDHRQTISFVCFHYMQGLNMSADHLDFITFELKVQDLTCFTIFDQN